MFISPELNHRKGIVPVHNLEYEDNKLEPTKSGKHASGQSHDWLELAFHRTWMQ